MSTDLPSTEASTRGVATLEVNTIALIVAISVIGTALVVVCLVGIAARCRVLAKRRRRDRSRQYMVQDGTSPYSSVHGHSSGGLPSYDGVSRQWGSNYYFAGGMGYDSKAVDFAEFRPNPIAENPFQHQPSLLNLPPSISEYNVDKSYNSPQFSKSSQSLNYDNGSFYASLYERLVDTTHSHRGRPLYLCKRENYHSVSNYFDIIGKTRTNDWLIRPRQNVPNRPPPRKASKKRKAPKPGNAPSQTNNLYRDNTQISNGFIARPGASSKITTPFGAADRYFGVNQLANSEQGYASLPRDGKLQNGQRREGAQLRRQASSSAADRPARQLEEQQYAHVMRKNALNGGLLAGSSERRNPSRRPISTIEEVPHVSPTSLAKDKTTLEAPHRERSGSASTLKSFGKTVTDQFQFLEQYETEEERF